MGRNREAETESFLRLFFAGCPDILDGEGNQPFMIAATRFLWNATRGYRVRPWRSEFIRWRIETYSGMKAEELTARDVIRFVWQEKGNLLRFLRWTGEIESLKKQPSSSR